MSLELHFNLLSRLAIAGVAADDLRLLAIPQLRDPLVFSVFERWEERSELLQYGIELTGTPGAETTLVIDRQSQAASPKATIQLFGGAGNLIVLGADHKLAAPLRLEGQRQTFVSGSRSGRPFHSNSIIIRGDGAAIYLGSESTSNGANLLVDGDNTSIVIGDDCLLANGIEIQATDSHAIFEIETFALLPTAESIFIDRHVWIGAHVSILKASRIGKGSIIGARSVVTGEISSHALWAGSPARLLRSGVSWTRPTKPSASDMRAALQ